MVDIDLSPKHVMKVPALGVFIAPDAVARLFQLHDYTRCPRFVRGRNPQRVLYPILRPNVFTSPRFFNVSRRRRLGKDKVTRKGDISMYVGDRDTYTDTFCQVCGELADIDEQGICEDCHPDQKYTEIIAIMKSDETPRSRLKKLNTLAYEEERYIQSCEQAAETLRRLIQNTAEATKRSDYQWKLQANLDSIEKAKDYLDRIAEARDYINEEANIKQLELF